MVFDVIERKIDMSINYGIQNFLDCNKDVKANVRFGVIPQNHVLQSWADESNPVYIDIEDSEEYDEKEIGGYIYEDNGYLAQSDDNGDIFITKSPYYTYAKFCSPCAPGTCYLPDPLNEEFKDNKCYCFGHEWFEENRAPYTVYSTETNEIILPE